MLAAIVQTSMKRYLVIGVLTLAGAATMVVVVRRHDAPVGGSAPIASAAARTYVGNRACADCHAQESGGWRGSQHAAAMAEATDRTVLGRFDNASFRYAGTTSTLFRRGGKFYARTDGGDGRLADFEIAYTFGVAPLQQYLIRLPGGRLQALGIAWDTRPAAAGGQRWFHLYPTDAIKAGDPLHWTGLHQNANFMCLDCHTTDLRKGYNAATHAFDTTWLELGVGCESCHGPGSAHVTWARAVPASAVPGPERYLTAPLTDRKGRLWTIDPVTAVPSGGEPRLNDHEIEVCARCHARRSQLTDAARAGDPFENGFRPAFLEPALYHADGQQRDEVYTYGSFLQSKMYSKGVTCSDCHDPHTGGLRRPGNATCGPCHLPEKYDSPVHHLHRKATPAGACVTCHMATTTYMGVDPRHDHGFRVPRPDQTITLGVPNACTNACHRDRNAAWAAAVIARRVGHAPSGFQRFADAFHAADLGGPGAGDALLGLVRDASQPAIVRASALARLAADGIAPDAAAAAVALRDASPLVRRAALDALQHADADTRLRLVPALLTDPIRTVRIQAVICLTDVAEAQLPGAFRAASDEYLAEQRFNADRPEAQTNLGTVRAARGQLEDAIAALREAIRLDRTFVPAYVNLGDVYRSRGDEAASEQILRAALVVSPASAEAHHALGLSLVRQQRPREGLPELAAAARLGPRVARYAYVYGVALHDTGSADQARKVLTDALASHPFDRDTLSALVTYSAEAGRRKDAETYEARLRALEGR